MNTWHIAGMLTVIATSVPATTTVVLSAPGEVLSHQKISDTQGNFTGTLDDVRSLWPRVGRAR